MSRRGQVSIQNNSPVDAVRSILRSLFERSIVDALLVPIEGTNGSVMPALVRHSSRIDQANPLAPVMAFNSARLVSTLTRTAPNAKLGVVLRSCELRALIELCKFKQANLDNVVTIGVDCLGTLTVTEYAKALVDKPDLTHQYLLYAQAGNPPDWSFRSACLMCEHPAPSQADIGIGFIGHDSLQVEICDRLADKFDLNSDEAVPDQRQAALHKIITARNERREADLHQFHERMRTDGGMVSYFSNCLECTNCMNACPICYCKECFFRTENAERAPSDLLHIAERQGALNMPADAVLFQLTRLNHMAMSCVGCGMCEAACPNGIPLTAMFRSVGGRVQKLFGYEPGKNLEDKPPFMVFLRDELQEIGESRE